MKWDFPDSTKSCAVRNTTTVAPAALLFLNNEFIRDQAKHFAQRVQKTAGEDGERQVQEVYRIALARPATDEELKLGIAFLAEQSQSYAGGSTSDTEADSALEIKPAHRKAALINYCQAVMGLNEFVYID